MKTTVLFILFAVVFIIYAEARPEADALARAIADAEAEPFGEIHKKRGLLGLLKRIKERHQQFITHLKNKKSESTTDSSASSTPPSTTTQSSSSSTSAPSSTESSNTTAASATTTAASSSTTAASTTTQEAT